MRRVDHGLKLRKGCLIKSWSHQWRVHSLCFQSKAQSQEMEAHDLHTNNTRSYSNLITHSLHESRNNMLGYFSICLSDSDKVCNSLQQPQTLVQRVPITAFSEIERGALMMPNIVLVSRKKVPAVVERVTVRARS